MKFLFGRFYFRIDNIIEYISEKISQQEIQSGLRKRRIGKEANEVFLKAATWLVTDASAAKGASEKGYITVGRDAALYTKEKPDRTGMAPFGLSHETAIRDPKTEAGALNSLLMFDYLEEVDKGKYKRDGKGPPSATKKYAATKKLFDLFDEAQQIK